MKCIIPSDKISYYRSMVLLKTHIAPKITCIALEIRYRGTRQLSSAQK